ncbi:MAG: agmatine deiminase family protein [Gemmatimonadota bacterium]
MWIAILAALIGAQAVTAAGPVSDPAGSAVGAAADAGRPAHLPGVRHLVGDWEPADGYLVGREALWGHVVECVSDAIAPRPVTVVSPAEGSHESAWVRDYGPLAVRQSDGLVWLDAAYYPDRPTDDALPGHLGRSHGIPTERLPHRLEGGAIASNGRGLCVMTDESRRRVAAETGELEARLGCPDLVIVPALPGEPTGHVDQLVQFLAPDLAIVATLHGNDVSPADDALADEAASRLAAAARSTDRGLRVVRVPAYRDGRGRYFSYVNVVSLRDRLLVPDFTAVPGELQKRAHERLRRAAGVPLVPVAADQLALSGGGLHCIVLGLHHRFDRSLSIPPSRRKQ